jgi:hypothetical protein
VLSESARVTSAAELRFRVQAPNSRPRATTIIALDGPSEVVIRRLAEDPWNHATFLEAPTADPPDDAQASDGWVTDLQGRRRRLRDEVNQSDQVIMMVAAGGPASGAETIGRACSLRRVTTTALIVGAEGVSDGDLSRTLARVRPWSLMVVIAGNDDYVMDMMTALRV